MSKKESLSRLNRVAEQLKSIMTKESSDYDDDDDDESAQLSPLDQAWAYACTDARNAGSYVSQLQSLCKARNLEELKRHVKVFKNFLDVMVQTVENPEP